MSTPLTIHILVKNNEKTIEHTLYSILSLNATILVGDLGCNDETINKCKQFNSEIIRISLNNDFSQSRNYMLNYSKNKWNMYIEPWEILLEGAEEILKHLASSPNVYKLAVLQGDVLTKQKRLWHKDMECKFANPVFETLISPSAIEIPVYLATGQHNSELTIQLVEKWREKNPFALEPIYYTACAHLSNKNWDAFLNYAEMYLHQEKSDIMSVYMIHYYSSMVNCYIKNDYQKSANLLLKCLIKNPTMAEFWCLLGDIYYAIKDYERAISFYENAIILGEKRLINDWPMEISKYKEYPQKMIASCDKIKQSLRLCTMKSD